MDFETIFDGFLKFLVNSYLEMVFSDKDLLLNLYRSYLESEL